MTEFTVTADNLHTVARDTIVAGRKLARNYSALVTFYGLDTESESSTVTDAARSIVLAAYPDTDPDRLAGKNKNDDQRWKDARAVRIGLVNAIKADAPETDDQPETVVNLLTRAGLKAELADVVAAWKAAQDNN